MRKHFALMVLLVVAFDTTNVLADEDESFSNYDSIVNELKSKANEPLPKVYDDSWDEVALHAGIGLNTSLVSFTLPDNRTGSGLFKGLQFTFGSNLFSRLLRGEAAYTSYQHEYLDANMGGDLKELEARLIFLPPTGTAVIARAGVGLAMRYMDITSRGTHATNTYSASTPSYLLLFGLEKKLTKTITAGPDLSYRSTTIINTFDKSSWDASFRLNATF